MRAAFLVALSGALLQASSTSASLTERPSQSVAIPAWDIQSTEKVTGGLSQLSSPGVDTSTWHHVDSSRCTLMGCLIAAGVYLEDDLFFSDNLRDFDASIFHANWLYRSEFALEPGTGKHYLLETHGITSRGEIYLNGKEVAKSSEQAGAYAGHTYDITSLVGETNALLVQTHPTNYNYDFALGFVDWNPYPPDNGTGVWREIHVKQTGPVAMGPLRVVTEVESYDSSSPATVQLKARITNLEDRNVTVDVEGEIVLEGQYSQPLKLAKSVSLQPGEITDVTISQTVTNPAIWWPRAWGVQPLYKGTLTAIVSDAVSDSVQSIFGIRTVTSKLNEYNDTTFFVNGHPFQVIGGGYSADMFLRWDTAKFESQARLMLDLGHNTVRLEGKNEHPELYQIADQLGLMVMAGWECCDKWEAWTYNEDIAINDRWTDEDYEIAKNSMVHEALMQQSHPSMLAYLLGSDYWTDDRATKLYVDALQAADWQVPMIASASKRGYPDALGPSGMKMEGPYDWVSTPNYWYDVEPSEDRYGSSFGFGSELGAGVGTPELSSLKRFLSEADMEDLWKHPDKGLYHMSTNVSSFYTREIYNQALWQRLGAPSSLGDYLLKSQILDYEATRAQFEGFAIKWNADRPATGLIYWMLNNAWPSLHWNLFDYYLRPAGSYFGAKVGARVEHVAYNYVDKTVHIINHSIDVEASRRVEIDVIGTDGKVLYNTSAVVNTEPNSSKQISSIANALDAVSDVVFLRLVLKDDQGAVLSRNVYWLSPTIDTLDWDESTWYYTPVTEFADLKALTELEPADVTVTLDTAPMPKRSTVSLHEQTPNQHQIRDIHDGTLTVVLENKSEVPAFFIRMNLVDAEGEDVLPVFWSDNYVTLWPHEKVELQVRGDGAAAIQVSGGNVASRHILL
ncbi:family 2 glycoside hydrolase [Microdochium trichocladiopsis]|uniref:Family 2 glycoside hydrolase n=1 Tax=Microdochium trichocladiopsis TaxID=1682393 RepID=A0A9P8Y2B1_9PEZI|nr:family 2 glycoside hydrolase [Microdochium trichocladiopsis]KAH7027588.1 family 2 glycoside hydrolase [Microdochium trichocladiopsis]